jgi:Polysaccharide deacetylase
VTARFDCVVTLDLDWAPDDAIDTVAQLLDEAGVPATWFVTHASSAVARLRAHEGFELGLHPNFLPGSTHGDTVADVLQHCLELVPDATSMRTHALVQSTPILTEVLARTPIRVDASLFLPRAVHVEPIAYRWHGETLVRVPYVWEDDVELENGTLGDGLDALIHAPGLKVFDFHPAHVFLNSTTMERYRQLSRGLPDVDLAPHVEDGNGVRVVFERLLSRIAGRACRIADLV